MNDKLEAQVATAEQVRERALARLQQETAAGDCEEVRLPSGLVFTMRRPRPLWWALEGRLPSSMAARVASDGRSPEHYAAVENHAAVGGNPSQHSSEESAELSRWLVALLAECVVAPKIRLNPCAGEVDPNWLSDEDALFILTYAGGGAMAGGQSLERFPRFGQPAAVGTGRGDVEVSSEPDVGD